MAIYKTLVKKVSIPPDKKTKQKQYEVEGKLAIIDQGQKLIGGYSDDQTMKLECSLPVIVFGDHTCTVKYIDFPFGAGADGIKVLEPSELTIPKYLYYGTQYLTLRFPDKGYARHYQHIEKMDLTIPPRPEQERIVTRIEELFSELDKAVETLQTIKQQLAVYRQAVLKEAFEGKLTNSTISGKRRLGEYIEKPRYGTSKKCGYDTGKEYTAVIRIPNINAKQGIIDHSDLKYAKFDVDELKLLSLEEGDILIIRSNGSVSIVGMAAMVRSCDINDTFAGYLIRLRIHSKKELLPKYLLHFLSSYEARSYIERVAKSTSGVNNINAQEIARLEIPVTSMQEQIAIVTEIESRLSVCESIEQTVDTALAQADAMRQSILKQAFEGGFNQ